MPRKSAESNLRRNHWLSVLKLQQHPQIVALIELEDTETELPEWYSEEERTRFWSQVETNFKYHLNHLLSSENDSARQQEASSGANDGDDGKKQLQDEALQFIMATVDSIHYDISREDEASVTAPSPLVHVVTIMEGLLGNDGLKYQVKCCISNLFDVWCKKRLPLHESLKKTTFICHLQRSVELSTFKADTAKVWHFREGLKLYLDNEELDPTITKLLLDAPKRSIFITSKEGRSFIAYTMTFSKTLTEEIHEVIKKQLETSKTAAAQHYGEIYYTAWYKAPQEIKEVIERKYQIYMHYFFEFRRKGLSLSPLGANVFCIARCFHVQRKNQATRKMLSSVYRTLLFTYLQDGCHNNRCNAAQVLFDVYPMEKPGAGRAENSMFLEEQHQYMTKFLTDRCHYIRIIAIRQLCAIMAEYWQSIPLDVIKEWITIIIRDLANDAADIEVRRSVYRSLPKLFDNPYAEEYMKEVLPRLKRNFHDINQNVRAAYVDMLLELKTTTIKYWNVVPMTHCVARLELENRNVGIKLVNLIADSFIAPHFEPASIMGRLANMVLMNKESVRMFFLYSEEQLGPKQAIDLIIIILPVVVNHVKTMLEQNRRSLDGALSTRTDNNRKPKNKKKKKLFCGKENVQQDSSSDKEDDTVEDEIDEDIFTRKDCHNPHVAKSYIDIVSILWTKHFSSYEKPKYAKDVKKFRKMCAVGIPLFLRYYKDTDVYASVLYLCSTVPISVLKSVSNVESMLLSQLKKLTLASKREDILIRVQPLCMWDHASKILDMAQEWLNEAYRVENLNSSFCEQPTRRRKKVNFERPQDVKPRLGLRLLAVLLEDAVISVKLMEKNYVQLMEMWLFMSKIKTLLATRMESGRPYRDPMLSEEFLQECFKEYILLIPSLNGKDRTETDKIDSVAEFIFIMGWAEGVILPGVPDEPPGDPHRSSNVGVSPFSRLPLAIHLIVNILEVAGDMAMIGQFTENLACVAGKFCLNVLRTGCGMMFVRPVTQYLSKFLVYLRRHHKEDHFNLFRSVTITVVIEILNIFGKMHYDQNTAERLLEHVTEVKNFLLKILTSCQLFGKIKQNFYQCLAESYVVCLLKILKNEFSVMQVVEVLKKTKDLPFLAQQVAVGLVKDADFKSVFVEEFQNYFAKTADDLSTDPLLLLGGFSLLHLLAIDSDLKLKKNNLQPALQALQKCLNSYKEHRNELNATHNVSCQNATLKLDVEKELDVLKKACRVELLGRDCMELWEIDELLNQQLDFGNEDE